ncbi:hypothetical protein DPEC_G00157930 [Dallia pectoralis]|uniref:Uncharacterized protein n=1 Tax=Dallia pectoralis TaxID=75939 RepID=A0ACC2GL23_DALPE|nr:hypothetical protein DPEC_G00157930 [Dallia pectoralis]
MTRGAWTWTWIEPRENQDPCTDSERTQRWRLSLASLLFLTILLSDHLWFCAEAKRTRTRDKSTTMGPSDKPILSSHTHSAHSSLTRNQGDIFIGNSTEPCVDESCSDCFTLDDAEHLCAGLTGTQGARTLNISGLYLSFCNSYSLLDLFYGSTSPDNLNCSLDVLMDGDMERCSLCVQAYQRYDQHALEKYEEFEHMTQRYETDAYSVRTCMDQCKVGWRGSDTSGGLA